MGWSAENHVHISKQAQVKFRCPNLGICRHLCNSLQRHQPGEYLYIQRDNETNTSTRLPESNQDLFLRWLSRMETKTVAQGTRERHTFSWTPLVSLFLLSTSFYGVSSPPWVNILRSWCFTDYRLQLIILWLTTFFAGYQKFFQEAFKLVRFSGDHALLYGTVNGRIYGIGRFKQQHHHAFQNSQV